MENSDVLLYLLLYARGKSMRDNERIPTKIHLQKEIFLLQKRYPFTEIKNKYEFIPLFYGPFSKQLAVDLNDGIDSLMISDDGGISLTQKGFSYASKLWNSLSDGEKVAIIKIKEEFNRITTGQLIDYVYDHYPKFSRNSALKKESVDNYFDSFWKENDLSAEYFVDIVKKERAE